MKLEHAKLEENNNIDRQWDGSAMVKGRSKSKSSKKGKTPSETTTLNLKQQLAQKRRAQRARREVIQIITMTAAFGAIIGVLLALVVDPKAGAAAVAGLPCLVLSYKYPRKALWAFMIYMPFSGTIIYAIGNSPLLQLAKDGIYIPALIGLIQECKQQRKPIIVAKSLMVPLGILCASSLLTLLFANGAQQLLPPCSDLPGMRRGITCEDGQPILMGILGLKVFLGYIPLIFCAYYLIHSKKELLFLSRMFTVLAIMCCSLAFIQYMMLKTGRCAGTQFREGVALFKASLDARCFVGGSLLYSPQVGQIRLPGTFVAPWQWGWFLISNAFFSFATAFSDPSGRWRSVGLAGMASVFVLAVVSGQRIALALVPTVTVILMVLTGQVTNLKRFLPILGGLGLLLGIAATAFPEVVQERIDSLIGRWEAAPADDFILHQFAFTWHRLRGSLIGLGLGRATNSARVFGKTSLVETWFPKVMHEVGPLGLLAFLIFVTAITVLTFKAYRSVKNKDLRSIGASYWVFILFISYQTYYYPLDVDPVAVYYWLMTGIILKLPEINRQEQEELEKLEAAQENDPKLKKKGRIKASKKGKGKRQKAKARVRAIKI